MSAERQKELYDNFKKKFLSQKRFCCYSLIEHYVKHVKRREKICALIMHDENRTGSSVPDPLRSPSDKKYDFIWILTKRLNIKYGHTYD